MSHIPTKILLSTIILILCFYDNIIIKYRNYFILLLTCIISTFLGGVYILYSEFILHIYPIEIYGLLFLEIMLYRTFILCVLLYWVYNFTLDFYDNDQGF